jgi:hypothetical protein
MILSTLVRRITHSRLASASMISSILLVLAGTIALASIPDSAGVIHGCYATRNGALRVIDAATRTCNRGEIAILWNQVGPQGLQGIQGIQGIPGTNGINGKGGTDGNSVGSAPLALGDPNCPNGGSQFSAVTGVTYACNGAAGPIGKTGAQGPQGPPGTGSSGATVYTNNPYPVPGLPLFVTLNGFSPPSPARPPGPADFSTVTSLSLPSGNYEVQADVTITNGNASNRLVECDLVVAYQGFIGNIAGMESTVAAVESQAISLHGTIAGAGAAALTVSLACLVYDPQSPSTVVANGPWVLTATAVGSVNVQGA